MHAKDVLKTALISTQHMLAAYVADLADADLQVVPVPGMNTIAWQIGHLTASEKGLISANLPGAAYPNLPPLVEKLGSGSSAKEYPQGGDLSKSQLLDLFNKVRNATLAAVDKASDADLAKATTGPLAQFAPNVADLIVLAANHTLMHAGQFTAVRRALGKPVIF